MAELANIGQASEPREASTPDDASVTDLMARVGERVRHARERQAMPRRVLSERSGVSPRYLSQLEAGTGNISIGLLHKVAMALNLRIEWLTSDPDPWTSEALQISDLYRSADPEVQDQVMRLLGASLPENSRGGRVCLLGLRGAGKSTLGKLASQALGVQFVELNKVIEADSGMPLAEVMALYGQEGYRKFEAEALNHVVATHDRFILAVAGGIVSDPEIYNRVLSDFHTIWLKASAEDHMTRVRAQGDERPMTGNPEAMEQLKSILNSREAVYDRALVRLATTGKSVKQSLEELLALIRSNGFLD